MEWFSKMLSDAGVGDETATTLVEKMKSEFPNHAVPKEQYNKKANALKELESEHNTAKEQLEGMNSQLEELKKSAEVSEETRKKLEELEEYKNGEESRTNAVKMGFLVREGLAKEKATDSAIKLLQKEFDLSKLSIGENDELVGFSEQLTHFKETMPDLFVSEKVSDPIGEPQSGDKIDSDIGLRSFFGLD